MKPSSVQSIITKCTKKDIIAKVYPQFLSCAYNAFINKTILINCIYLFKEIIK